MKTIRNTAAAILLLALTAGAAHAGRLTQIFQAVAGGGGSAIECVVVEGPRAVPGSQESDALCLDVSISMRVIWVRFGASDRARVDQAVRPGAALRIQRSTAIEHDGRTVVTVDRWSRTRRRDQPILEDRGARTALLAWALRDRADVARFFEIDFGPVASQLLAVSEMIESTGEPVAGFCADRFEVGGGGR